MIALADLSLVEAADAVERREVSSAALLEACLARLDAVNKTLNATIWVDRD
jgi:aspartyl-tRNA(Asn)/glutamyl-tRNA(Gln) amidotransferase subunit A